MIQTLPISLALFAAAVVVANSIELTRLTPKTVLSSEVETVVRIPERLSSSSPALESTQTIQYSVCHGHCKKARLSFLSAFLDRVPNLKLAENLSFFDQNSEF